MRDKILRRDIEREMNLFARGISWTLFDEPAAAPGVYRVAAWPKNVAVEDILTCPEWTGYATHYGDDARVVYARSLDRLSDSDRFQFAEYQAGVEQACGVDPTERGDV